MSYKILVADDNPEIRDLVKKVLQDDFEILQASDGIKAINAVAKHPDLLAIIMGLSMPELDGFKATQILKSKYDTYHIPIIIMTQKPDIKDMQKAINMGADDYIRKPFKPEELKARLIMNLQRTQRDQSSNPLTKLPGNATINRVIEQRLSQESAFLYADLDNFKAYNDKYGFAQGDKIIIRTAKIISDAIKEFGNPTDFLGHVGGDDFITISIPKKAAKIAKAICKNFDKMILEFYDQQDQERKKIMSHDRKGNMVEYPIMSISIAIITNEYKEFTTVIQLAQIAAELKKHAKSKPGGVLGSNYVTERRRK
jgi:diguanylate cyclase (GGDEF)-like protein